MNNKKTALLLGIVIFISITYGISAGVYKFFPFELFDNIKGIVLNEDFQSKQSFDKYIYDVDVESLIQIQNNNDIIEKQNLLINYIWKSEKFPNSLPNNVERNFIDQNYNDLSNLKQIDRIEISMDYNVNSIIYHFIAENSNNELVIYHQGHGGDFLNGKESINGFLKNGYSVLAVSMPLLGMNNQPIVDSLNHGKIKLASHNTLVFLDTEDFSPIKFFVTPLVISLNYLNEEFNYENYFMVGLSGGAWTTMLYSAIDDRISKNFPVAGPWPLYLTTNYDRPGDYETLLPELYEIANYLELYIMGSYGDRTSMQIYNNFDPCCFSGDYYKTYESIIQSKLQILEKGNFEVFSDDSHTEHKISQNALEKILQKMDEGN